MYIIIVGGGNVGYYLAKTLFAAKHEVLLLEKDRLRYRTISEELGEIVMQGDGCQADQQTRRPHASHALPSRGRPASGKGV